MAICDSCNQEMTTRKGCTMTSIDVEGVSYARIPLGNETLLPPGARCGDCGVKRGSYHHPGCAREQCPRCGDQLFCCDCEKDDDSDDDE